MGRHRRKGRADGMTVKELKKFLNSTTEWDDAEVKVSHTHADGSGCCGDIKYVVIKYDTVFIGDNSDGDDYTIATEEYYRNLIADRIMAKYGSN